jgi:hypothetical protein
MQGFLKGLLPQVEPTAANGLHPYLIYDLTVTEPKLHTAPVQSLVLDRHHLPCDQDQPLP